MNLKKEIKELENTLKIVLSKKVFQEKAKSDFNQKEQYYYKKDIISNIERIKECLNSIPNYGKETLFTEKVKSFLSDFEVLTDSSKINPNSIEKSLESLRKLSELIEVLPEKKEEKAEQPRLPLLPREISEEIRADFDELLTCFNNKCYRSSLILCGKILEVALHRKYFEKTGKDLLEKSPDIGLGNVLAKMREQNIILDPGLPQQIHLINQLRVYSVHKKDETFMPSKDQTQATILYTLDILKKLFK